jgi:Protein of unknown function (DUF3099)
MRRAVSHGKRPVYRITGAPLSLQEDVAGRQTRYLVSMGIRTACFLLAVAASGWLRWVLLVGALVLPYVAVVMANAGREPGRTLPVVAVDHRRRALPPGRSAPGAGLTRS